MCAERRRAMERREEEAQAPITIVPTRRALEDRQVTELRNGLQRVRSEIAGFQAFVRSMRVPAAGRTAAGISAECDRLDTTLSRLSLASIPVLGERYSDEIALIRRTVADARRAGGAGRLGEAAGLLNQSELQLSALGDIFEIELGIMVHGIPEDLRIEGVEPERAMEAVLDGLEGLILDVGTSNEGRFRNGRQAARLYADNADIYDIDNRSVRRERDQLLGFVARKGSDARARRPYPAKEAQEDERLLRSFVQNAERIRRQMGAHNLAVFTQWSAQLSRMVAIERNEDTRRRLGELRDEIEGALGRMRRGHYPSDDQIRDVYGRYRLLTGTVPPRSEEERISDIRESATALRGRARSVSDGSPEWYGAQALSAIAAGNMEMAALAVSMGMLERISSGSGGARQYISSYWQIHDIIGRRRPATPGMMSGYASQIELASLAAESDSIRREYAHAGTAQKRERVLSVARAVRERLSRGDSAGARRLLGMERTYIDMLQRQRWRDWNGSSDMEGALDSELQGEDGTGRFSRGLTYFQFHSELDRFRTATADWGRGMSAQKGAVESSMSYIEERARAGDATEARRALTLLVMYTDAVERLGVRRGGRVVSLGTDDGSTVGGMERAMGALARGEQTVDQRQIEDSFMESFGAAQRTYVDREATRLGTFASSRALGRDTVNEALSKARERANAGDYRGAILLLGYVRDFYGAPVAARPASGGVPAEDARNEGWRYALITGPGARRMAGYYQGSRQMLEAIRMEANADSEQMHVASAQMLDRGSRRIAQTEILLRDATSLRQRYEGVIPFVDDQPDTRGKLPLGERSGTSYPDYIDLAYVRDYERSNPDDAQLAGGHTLSDDLFDVNQAAERGNVTAYNRARDVFDARFRLVAGRAVRTRTIDSARTQLTQLERGIREMRTLYGSPPPAAAAARLDALEERRSALLRSLTGMRGATGEFPSSEYSHVLVDFDRERRLASAYSVVKGQLDLTETYRRLVVGQAQGQLMAFARDQLAESRPHLEAALTALAGGDMDTAEAEYRAGIYQRRIGLGFFQAENALTFRRSGSWTRGISEMGKFIWRGVQGESFEENAAQVGGRSAPGQASPEFAGYQNMHTDAFHEILYGRGTREESERINSYLGATRLLELSIFGVPADNVSQSFSDFVPDQRFMRDQLRDVSAAVRAGDPARATQLMGQMQTRWEAMNQRAQDNQWWGNAATVVAALGISLIPGGGWVVGGAIFTTMAFERVVTEINLDGHASAEAWGMLALTVGTMGLGGAAAIARTTALAAEAAEATNAARLLTISRGLTYATLGVGLGFAGYTGYEAVQAFRAGRTRDGVLLTGMALFPFAHMAGARAWEGIRPRGGRATAAEVEGILEEAGPSAARPEIDIQTTETAQTRLAAQLRDPARLFEFLRDFASRDSAGRAALLESLPEGMRAGISRLAENPAVQRAMQPDGGGMNNELALAAMRREMASFGDTPPRPGGPGGTRPQWETSSWVRNAEAFRDFMLDLMAPDGAPAGRLNARDIARARLESLRAENPQAAQIIDGLLRNPTVREAVASGNDSPLSLRMMDEALNGRPARTASGGRPAQEARPGLRQLIPEDVMAAEQEAAQGYVQELAIAAGAEGQMALGPQLPPELSGRTPIRASAEGEGGGTRAPVQPARPGVTATEAPQGGRATAAPRGGGRGPAAPRGPAEAPPAEQPETLLRPGETRNVGRLEMWGRRFSAWRAQRVAARAARAQRAPVPEDFMQDAQSSLEDTLRAVVTEEMRPEAMYEAQKGVTDMGMRADIGNSIRTAPERVAEMMKSLWRRATERGAPRAQRDAAWRALSRLYSHENVRAALGEMARADPGLGSVLRQTDAVITQGARSARISLENYRARLAQQGLGDDVMFIVETMERQAAEPMARARAQVRQLETARIPELERQLATQQRAAQAATGRAQARANARVQALEQQLAAARGELAGLNNMLRAPQNQPLAASERALGMRLSPSERAAVMPRLQDAGIISGDAVLLEVVQAGRRAVSSLRGIATEGPVAEAMKQSVERSLTRSGDPLNTSLDDLLLGALRSDDVAAAVGRQHGARAETMFRAAVREGTLSEVLGRLRNDLPSDIGDPLSRFAGSARSALSEDLAVLSTLGSRAASVVGSGAETAGAIGSQFRPMRQIVGDWWAQSWARRGLRAMFRRGVGEPGTPEYREYSIFTRYFLEAGRDVLRTTPEGMTMARLGGYGRIGIQLAIWGAEGYMLYGMYQDIRDRLTNAPTTREGIRRCEREFGFTCSEENARWLMGDGADFFSHLPNMFPRASERRPGSAQALRAELERQEILIDPHQLDAVLSDGRQMGGRLADINRLLAQRRSGTADERQHAETELAGILQPWGISLQAVDRLLSSESKQSLDVTDMADLRMDDWVRRGLAVRFRDVVVETFLLDAGMTFRRGDASVQLLKDNPDVFVALWTAAQQGRIPSVYVDDAVQAISGAGVLERLRQGNMDDNLRDVLSPLHFYLATAIGENSFLGAMDRRATNAQSRTALESLLSQYRDNAAAMTAFNGFVLQQGDEIYGDPAELARLIVEHPRDAMAQARERGFIGPATLSPILSLPPAEQTSIVVFVRSHSDPQHGVARWLQDRQAHIGGHVTEILQELARNQQAAGMSATALYDGQAPAPGRQLGYLDRQADIFKRRGFWLGGTPSETISAQEAARSRAPPPPGGRAPQTQTRGDAVREEEAPRYFRRPGFEAMTPARTDAPVAVQLTADGEAFFSSERSGTLGAILDGIIDERYRDRRSGPNAAEKDGDVLVRLYGPPVQGPDGAEHASDAARRAIKAEIYRLLTSTNTVDVSLRSGWGITVRGQGDTLNVELDMRRARTPLLNHIMQYVRRLDRAGAR
jgi:hypothetical protein